MLDQQMFGFYLALYLFRTLVERCYGRESKGVSSATFSSVVLLPDFYIDVISNRFLAVEPSCFA